MTSFLQYFRNPFEERKTDKKGDSEAMQPALKEPESSRMPAPLPAASLPPQTPLAPAPMEAKPSPREFAPAKPLEPGTQLIKEPEIK
jgi:hypothetical protein